QITFTVSSTNAASHDMTVLVSTADGTASSSSDYAALSNQLVTILAGQTTATVTVTVNNDSIVEDNETFTASLSSPKFNGATDATRVVLSGTNSTATGTITNDDTATLSIANVSASEAAGAIT